MFLCFFLKSNILAFTFKSVIYFEFLLVYGVGPNTPIACEYPIVSVLFIENIILSVLIYLGKFIKHELTMIKVYFWT